MNAPSTGFVCLAFVALVVAGCDEPGELAPGGGATQYGTAELALREVPADVACVSIHVTGPNGHAEEHAFDVDPGDETIYRDLQRLRAGPATFRAEAFRVPCVAIGGATPNYDSDPAVAQIRPGEATAVTLFMRGVGSADVTLEFPGDDECLPDGELCVNDEDCCSGACAEHVCRASLNWGPAPFPADAVVISADEFEAKRAAGLLRPFNAGIVATDAAARRAEEDADALLVAELVGRRPDLANFARVAPRDGVPNGDGNWRHLVRLADGSEAEVVLHGQAAWNGTLADSLRNFPTRDNQLALHRAVYDALPDAARRGRISPDAMARLRPADITRQNRAFFSDWANIIQFLPLLDPNIPPGYVAECDQEEGAGLGLDRQACEGYAAGGIMENVSWPLKYFATCVKNQGSRGSCSGFAATSGVEMQVAQHHARWVNLSEQMAYGKYKLDWYPNYVNHGSYIHKYFERSMGEGFFFPFETQWNYNTSNSCGGYADPYCSPTTHQAKAYCTWSGDVGACAYELKPIAPAGFLPKAGATLGIEDKNLWLSMVILNLAVGNSVMVGTAVPPSFDGPDGNGFVTWNGPDEESRGGHGVHVTGFVTNQRLADEIPDAPPGAGGGYLVVKNSWGSCWSDGGYIYVPFEWAKAYMGGSYTLHSVW